MKGLVAPPGTSNTSEGKQRLRLRWAILRIPDWRWIVRWRILYPIRHGHSYMKNYEIAVRRALVHLSGKSFWDVGANTGYYTFMLAKNFDRVTAFEPNPAAADILRRKSTVRR